MTSVSVHEAKTHLSRLIERVLAGEEVTVTRNREPVIKLLPAAPPPAKKPLLGAMKDLLGDVDNDVWKPWTDEELGLTDWENRPL